MPNKRERERERERSIPFTRFSVQKKLRNSTEYERKKTGRYKIKGERERESEWYITISIFYQLIRN